MDFIKNLIDRKKEQAARQESQPASQVAQQKPQEPPSCPHDRVWENQCVDCAKRLTLLQLEKYRQYALLNNVNIKVREEFGAA